MLCALAGGIFEKGNTAPNILHNFLLSLFHSLALTLSLLTLSLRGRRLIIYVRVLLYEWLRFWWRGELHNTIYYIHRRGFQNFTSKLRRAAK